ncbi:hypothetical protein J7E97_30605 [Streptomyces sp. ISL-66]|uniref:hypothetical protein n=1 Tax=Streptomyces sp. ISL-66 TaxID=2819186 RepID=UPI001BE57FCC|nr:hypothetical protein [Streptomyces sp. ISL-66]MBT2472096.1 hypothetical protein [Streptomyces sp. ISL-66]
MPQATMDGCRAKLARADEHLRSFEDSLNSFRAAHPIKVTVERNVDEKAFIFHVYDVEPCNPEWGVLIGDCAHNARSSLDHLVFQLSVQGLGRGLTTAEARSSQFPVCEQMDSYRRAERGVVHLLPEHKQRIWEVQPFNAGDEKIWGPHDMPGPPAPIPSYLRELTNLNNADKHRVITPVWHGVGLVKLPTEFREVGGVSGGGTWAALEEGTRIGEWNFDSTPPKIPTGFRPEQYWTFHPSLRDPHFATSVSRILGNCLTATRMILDMFEPCVLRGEAPMPLRYWDGSRGL